MALQRTDDEALRGAHAGGLTGRDDSGRRRVNWRLVLVWLLRLLSMAWLAKGLFAWTLIFGIGFGEREPPAFESQLLSYQAIVVYFAVLDLVAAVGLWLTSTWGGVLWLLALVSHLLLGFFFPRFLPVPPYLIAGYIGLMAAYFFATWAAENEES